MASPTGDQSKTASERELRDINEALLVSSIHQHELVEKAQHAEAELRQREAELVTYAEELSRFNRVAVGRESRMIELKHELNELFQRHGEVTPYPLGFENEEAAQAERLSDASLSEERVAAIAGNASVPLESILYTEELDRRPHRTPDYATENRALASLILSLAKSPDVILRLLTEKILEVLQAGSAGISLLTKDGKRFYWPAIAGAWQPHIGGGTPRDFGPCGDVLDRNAPLLLHHPERRYPYFQPITPLVEEALLVPFYVEDKAVGTVWAISHDERRFDAEDLRQLESLGRFASAAYQAVGFRDQERSRRTAALNLLEDAVESRRAIEQANAELRASEERYRTLFNSIDEGFCVIEMLFDGKGDAVDYRFLETNPGFEKQTGLHSAAGNRMRELSPRHEARWFEKYGNVALTGESVRFINQAHDLGERWFDVYAFRLGGSESRRVAILLTDITERIRMEATTNEYAKSLADLNRRKDEFLAMLSHELRNPLASIMNAVHLLRLQRDRNPVQVEAHGMIDRQVTQLARLVDDLLEVSRISTGRIRLQMDRTDFRGIVRRATETMQAQADVKSQSIVISLPDELLWVHGDSVRLEQVVVNLLNNAVKYTDRNGHIWVELELDGDVVNLRIRDDGVGIAQEMLPRIFDLFTQADKSLDRAQGGLGIGLALVKSLVTLHRGQVEASSTLGKGSEFTVKLPPLLLPPASIVDLAVDAAPAAHSVKVLVVDDNVDAAQSIAMLLGALGHDARLAQDGASAMAAALDYRPDVVLLDIGLPVVDGFEVAKAMRQQPSLKDAVLVALTGYGRDSDRQRSREAGFNHHLVKPVDFSKIESILSATAGKTL